MELKGKGQEIDIFDSLIAAIILTNGFKDIIINNPRHSNRIENLVVQSF